MMEEDNNEYVMELEHIVSSLKQKLDAEVKARKIDAERNQVRCSYLFIINID